jgi:hypothetical protein
MPADGTLSWAVQQAPQMDAHAMLRPLSEACMLLGLLVHLTSSICCHEAQILQPFCNACALQTSVMQSSGGGVCDCATNRRGVEPLQAAGSSHLQERLTRCAASSSALA